MNNVILEQIPELEIDNTGSQNTFIDSTYHSDISTLDYFDGTISLSTNYKVISLSFESLK